jgi:hypothetical protein
VYAYHHGQFDYNHMPLALLGCTVQFYIKPIRHKSQGEHSSDDWYLGASPKHFQGQVIFVKAACTQCIANLSSSSIATSRNPPSLQLMQLYKPRKISCIFYHNRAMSRAPQNLMPSAPCNIFLHPTNHILTCPCNHLGYVLIPLTFPCHV